MTRKIFRTFAIAVAALAIWATPLAAEPLGMVQHNTVCKLEAIKNIATASTNQKPDMALIQPFLETEECFMPAMGQVVGFEVFEVLLTKYIDWEGDAFYIVRVGDGVYTVAYPGMGSNIVVPASFHI